MRGYHEIPIFILSTLLFFFAYGYDIYICYKLVTYLHKLDRVNSQDRVVGSTVKYYNFEAVADLKVGTV
jgi:hypothetical protein